MNVLIVGSGGREHALAWKVAQSTYIERIWVTPGNAGTELENKVQNISINVSNIRALIDFAQKNKVDLTIVGSEVPLAAGIVDQFHYENLLIFGPTQKAAQLEASKSFCKKFLNRHNIPTANFVTFKKLNNALAYLSGQHFPIVIKANSLMAGKGVFIAQSLIEARDIVISIMTERKFSTTEQEIVIEEFLYGKELSFIAIVGDGHILPLASSLDHKRLFNEDQGPNTGGMGAYSPVSWLSNALQKKIMDKIMHPTISNLKAEGITYWGFLYAGLMITPDNEPKVLEFNVRLGDPETQPLMMRLRSDLIELILTALSGKLNRVNSIIWDQQAALTVVMTSGGYPKDYKRGDIINGLDYPLISDVKIFHGGTRKNNNVIVTNGGRVLSITALGTNLLDAQRKAYHVVSQISWPDCYYRDDIGYRAITRFKFV